MKRTVILYPDGSSRETVQPVVSSPGVGQYWETETRDATEAEWIDERYLRYRLALGDSRAL